MKISAVILTGTRNVHNVLLAGTDIQNKVLLPVGGKPMLLSVFEAIRNSRFQPEMFISSNDPDVLGFRTPAPFIGLPSEAKAVQSFLKSIERVPGTGPILFVSGDHPLLTPEMVDHFIQEALDRDLALAVAAVNRNVVNRHYPKSVRTYFPVKGGAYSGGNLFLVNRAKFKGNAEILEMIDNNRKKPWKSLFVLNPWVVFKILTRQVDIHEVARRASRLIGCETGIVDMPFAECCMDVDKPSDKAIAEEILKTRAARQPIPLNPPNDWPPLSACRTP